MSLNVLTQGGGTGGESASIFVKGLSESDTVTATKDDKKVNAVWHAKERIKKYRYIKWNLLGIRAANASGAQASEFGFYDSENNKFTFPSTTVCTQSVAATGTETADKLIDYDTSTKFNYGGNNAQAIDIWVMFDLGAGNEIDLDTYNRYYYYTANDAEGRDFVAWDLYASNDGETWVKIGGESGLSITTNRLSLAGVWDIELEPISGFIMKPIKEYGTWTVTATNGEDTVTQDVLVDAAIEYEIEMGYIYSFVDEFEGSDYNTDFWEMESPDNTSVSYTVSGGTIYLEGNAGNPSTGLYSVCAFSGNEKKIDISATITAEGGTYKEGRISALHAPGTSQLAQTVNSTYSTNKGLRLVVLEEIVATLSAPAYPYTVRMVIDLIEKTVEFYLNGSLKHTHDISAVDLSKYIGSNIMSIEASSWTSQTITVDRASLEVQL